MSTDQQVAHAGAAMLENVIILVRDSVTVLVRLCPQITAVWLLGWLGDQLSVRAAAILGDTSGWAAVVVFSAGFLFDLVAVVVILRLAGAELGIRALVPPTEDASTGAAGDDSLTRLVAVTLLPFLGLYSAFGLVDAKAQQLTNEQFFRDGVFTGGPSVLSSVRGLAERHAWWMVGLLVGVYVLRRAVDHLHERTGIRLLGILTAVVESFFLLVVIYGGWVLLQRPGEWASDRVAAAWFDAAGRAVGHALAALHPHLPELVRRFGSFLADPVWPMFSDVVSQPIIWLAVAALVYGSQVLSLAELWRRGQPAAARVLGASRFDRYREKRALLPTAPVAVRRVGGQVQEAFLGDIDDKYLPTLHSLRLVLRAGVGFLGAFVFVYALVQIGQSSARRLSYAVLGGHDIGFWYQAGPVLSLVTSLPWEPLRLCLLAVAFRRCLELFRQRSEREAALRQAQGATQAEAVPGPVTGVPA